MESVRFDRSTEQASLRPPPTTELGKVSGRTMGADTSGHSARGTEGAHAKGGSRPTAVQGPHCVAPLRAPRGVPDGRPACITRSGFVCVLVRACSLVVVFPGFVLCFWNHPHHTWTPQRTSCPAIAAALFTCYVCEHERAIKPYGLEVSKTYGPRFPGVEPET